jgi:hypothetical protein
MAHRNRWFTELNSMVMASMAMLKLNNQMVPVMRLFVFFVVVKQNDSNDDFIEWVLPMKRGH